LGLATGTRSNRWLVLGGGSQLSGSLLGFVPLRRDYCAVSESGTVFQPYHTPRRETFRDGGHKWLWRTIRVFQKRCWSSCFPMLFSVIRGPRGSAPAKAHSQVMSVHWSNSVTLCFSARQSWLVQPELRSIPFCRSAAIRTTGSPQFGVIYRNPCRIDPAITSEPQLGIVAERFVVGVKSRLHSKSIKLMHLICLQM